MKCNNIINNSLWLHGPKFLLETNPVLTSTNIEHIQADEIIVEIPPVVPTSPVIKINNYSSLTAVFSVSKCISKWTGKFHSYLKMLTFQEQRLHCPSIVSHLESNVKVPKDITNTINQLSLFLENA